MQVFHFLPSRWAVEVIHKQRIKVSKFDDLNDPFELYAAELSDKKKRGLFKNWKKEMAAKFGLICFSKNWSNPLLWSHYADRHKGVALEFSVPDNCVANVNYHPERLVFDLDRKISVGELSEQDAFNLLVTKFEHWRYEEEVRVFKRKTDCTVEGNYWFSEFGPDLELVGLVHGPLCCLSEREIASALPKGKMLKITKARLAFKSFSVVQNHIPGIREVKGIA